MTTPKVGFATYREMKARTLAIAKGELHPKPSDPRVWAISPASYARWMFEPKPAEPLTCRRNSPRLITEDINRQFARTSLSLGWRDA